MARRPRLFAAGVLYHVIVRGNQRQKTFLSDRDYQAYMAGPLSEEVRVRGLRILFDAEPCTLAVGKLRPAIGQIDARFATVARG